MEAMDLSGDKKTSDLQKKPRYSPGLAFCRSDLVLVLCIAVLALFPYTVGKYLQARATSEQSGMAAVLTVDGKEVWREELTGLASETTYSVEFGTEEIVICADASGAWVEASDCPDQICVHTGKLSKVGQAAVCIPFRVVLKIVATNPSQPDEVDAVSGSCGGLYEILFG